MDRRVPSLLEKEQSDVNVANILGAVSWIQDANHLILASSKEVKLDATVNHVFAHATIFSFIYDLPMSDLVLNRPTRGFHLIPALSRPRTLIRYFYVLI